MSSLKNFRVGIVTGSTRVPRAAPQVSAFILDAIQAYQASKSGTATASSRNIDLDAIDLASLHLPLYNEPGIPAAVKDPETEYVYPATRAWSARASACDAFVFVSPQYNWGIPAALKNAIDYLYNEWRYKPAMIVTYGGHGGDKCAAQLRVVLGGGLKMVIAEPTIGLSFGSKHVAEQAQRGEDMGIKLLADHARGADDPGLWADKRGEVVLAWEALVNELETKALRP